eukprot:TRINITY_DN30100_c0_g2_i1.p1 TRINITY_DN30100_c0_g2~~TRINITY_DN30100_c0_g2_i1.p1  ORF type:complete len:236 (-),score=33.64 TRINITY_DN30100_c0_g2_i1:291-998(-)
MELKEVNVPTKSTIALMKNQAGSFKDIGFTATDIRNFEHDIRHENKEYDAEMIIGHFEEAKMRDSDFSYAYKVDSEKRLTHCFWIDKISKDSYDCIGDVIVFDMTYDTNEYKLIFAPFTGVKHHGHSILMGCGLLENETTASFGWLFEAFLEAVSRKHPNAIITDQDPAIKAAIKKVFPHIHHRCCIWHIMFKLPKWLGPIAYAEKFRKPFNACIYNSEMPEEFEEKWADVIKKK